MISFSAEINTFQGNNMTGQGRGGGSVRQKNTKKQKYKETHKFKETHKYKEINKYKDTYRHTRRAVKVSKNYIQKTTWLRRGGRGLMRQTNTRSNIERHTNTNTDRP